jgi:hypothetical protein
MHRVSVGRTDRRCTVMRLVLWAVLAATLANASGCASFWHELQPHRLHRINRGPAPSLDPEFS